MTIFSMLAVAVALAMDAFAVSIAAGICLEKIDNRQWFRLWWHFGFFQAMMLIIGWAMGLTIRDLIERFDHWVAFGLLAVVGGNMLRSALTADDDTCMRKDPTRGALLIMLSLATSMDALAVGLSLSILNSRIWLPALIVGITAALFTAVGMMIGARASRVIWLKKYAEITGAIVLFVIGFHILWQHGALAALGG
jgi:putative Mn2+ efflux pump MntP